MRAVLFSWFAYFVVFTLTPIDFVHDQFFPATLAVFIFLSLFCISGLGFQAAGAFLPKWKRSAQLGERELERFLLIVTSVSWVGLVSLTVDKTVIQGIDYSGGIAAARNAWVDKSVARTGISSIFSVIGYAFSFMFMVSVAIMQLNLEFTRRRVRIYVGLTALVSVVAHSALTGGRSVVLVQMAMVAAIGVVRVAIGKRYAIFAGARQALFGMVLVLAALGYSMYVFGDRAEAGGIRVDNYAYNIAKHLRGDTTEHFENLVSKGAFVSTSASLATLVGGYLVHSHSTLQLAFHDQDRRGQILFIYARMLLDKLGLIEANGLEYNYHGIFLSLPGAIWYDYGWIGLVTGALLLGWLASLAVWAIRRGPAGLLSVGFSGGLIATLLASPVVPIIDMLCFPFMVWSFAISALGLRLVVGARSVVLREWAY